MIPLIQIEDFLQMIAEKLRMSAGTSVYIEKLEMIQWGRKLLFQCRAIVPDSAPEEFVLRFSDCREMRWQIYTHRSEEGKEAFPLTELVDFSVGRSEQRSPARILTEHFGLVLSYGKLETVRAGQVEEIS